MATFSVDEIPVNGGAIYVSEAPDHGAWVRVVDGNHTVEVCLSNEELDDVIVALQKQHDAE